MSTSTDLKTLQQELQQALSLINSYSAANGDTPPPLDSSSFGNTQSLLERCAAVVDAEKDNSKPTLRIIHHFACSGGTLISKCLAAQPNTFLLSELHPTTHLGMNINKASYTPRDITTQAIYGQVPQVRKLAETLFVSGIKETDQHIRELGGQLIIRAHSHADYCTTEPTPDVDTITRLLEPHFNLKHLVTVRHPVESFISLRENKWVHFEPDNFDEYCRRLLKFLKAFNKSSIIRYEDFVAHPKKMIKEVAKKLDLNQVSDDFEHIDIFKISGDSGRSGREISKRPPKVPSNELAGEIKNSKYFQQLIQLGFFEPPD
ncbi:sulfotransferase [Gilvimarinus chinensis]|uniref:sulfotransferase n=1 Tax=Gilvimarinus chinensis TaxID=396005 RepID=UPI000378F093|nr:sulfotransferase [Gilvimarinus chinensis]